MKILFNTISLFVFLSVGYAQKPPSLGQQWVNGLIETGKEWQAERKSKDCKDTLIEYNIRLYTESSDYHEKWRALRILADISCPIVQDFLLHTALSDTEM